MNNAGSVTWQEIWLSGLGAALVSGVVAALVAVLVVRLTERTQRQARREDAIFSQATKVWAAGDVLLAGMLEMVEPSGHVTRPDEQLTKWGIAVAGLNIMLKPVDPGLAHRLDERVDFLVNDWLPGLPEQVPDSEAKEVFYERRIAAGLAVSIVTGEVTSWLAARW
jgi:hypothetical protein